MEIKPLYYYKVYIPQLGVNYKLLRFLAAVYNCQVKSSIYREKGEER